MAGVKVVTQDNAEIVTALFNRGQFHGGALLVEGGTQQRVIGAFEVGGVVGDLGKWGRRAFLVSEDRDKAVYSVFRIM